MLHFAPEFTVCPVETLTSHLSIRPHKYHKYLPRLPFLLSYVRLGEQLDTRINRPF